MTNRIIASDQIKTNFDSHGINKGDILYYARIIPNCKIYDILELKIRTIEPTFFCGTEKESQQAFLFGYSAINNIVFTNRQMALEVVKDAELAEE